MSVPSNDSQGNAHHLNNNNNVYTDATVGEVVSPDDDILDRKKDVIRRAAENTVVAVSSKPGMEIGPIKLTTTQAALIGAIFIVVIGLIMAFTVPPPAKDPPPWDRISAVIGWWYFWAWAISFLPQMYLNWSRKSCVGQSFDYVFLNVLGFTCYAIYNVSFHFVDSIKEEYHRRFHNSNNVDINDVCFSVFALIGVIINSFQIAIYDRGSQKPSRWCLIFIAVTTAFLIIWFLILVAGFHRDVFFNPLDLLYGMSVVKLAVTLIKYLPQIYLNFKRKLTVGWNIWNVLLDFTGGSLSVLQELMDAGVQDNWSSIAGNLAKFFLGSCSMVYDVVFMIQHFCLYKENNRIMHEMDEARRREEAEGGGSQGEQREEREGLIDGSSTA